MPTNDERREVADGLRRQVKRLGPQMDAHEFAHYGADVIDAYSELRWDQMMLRLADLIEPEERTCHMRDASWDDGQCTWGCICSECGAKHEHERSGWMNFCPFCGAKVVKE